MTFACAPPTLSHPIPSQDWQGSAHLSHTYSDKESVATLQWVVRPPNPSTIYRFSEPSSPTVERAALAGATKIVPRAGAPRRRMQRHCRCRCHYLFAIAVHLWGASERPRIANTLAKKNKRPKIRWISSLHSPHATCIIPHPTHLRRRCGMRLFPPRPPPPAPASRRGVFRLVSGSRLVSGPCAGGGSLSSGEIAHRAVTRLPEKHSDVPCHDPAFDEGPPRAPSSRFLRAACKTRTTLFSLPPPVRRLPSEGFHSRRARPRPPASSLLGKTESLETSRDDASPHPTKPRTCHFNRATTS